MKVSAILDAIDLRSYALPEFQRGYVWGRDDVRQLMTSLYRKYPVGSLLVWETPVETTRLRDEDGGGAGAVVKLILDGQQRITSLYGVVRGEAPPFFQGKRDAFTDLYFDLRSEVFEFYGPVKMRDDPLWANVTEVHTVGLQPWFGRLSDLPEDDRNLYLERINRIAQITEIDLHVEEITGSNRSLDEVVDIFNRVNSGGTKLSKGDLALARICAQAPDAREMLTRHLDRWNSSGQQFGLDWFMRVVNALVTGQAAFTALRDVPAWEFTDQIDRAAEIIDRILDAIDSRLGLDPDRSLPAPNALPVIARHVADAGWPLPPEDLNRLLWWYVHAFTWGRFSASTETALQQDLDSLRAGGLDGLVAGMSRWRGTLRLQADDFVGSGRGSRLYPLLQLVSRRSGGRSFPSGTGLDPDRADPSVVPALHHIFPKSTLHEAGFDTRQRNSLANLCFLSGNDARSLRGRPPVEYLREISGTEAGRAVLASQWIPVDSSLWALENYTEFLSVRRELLAAAANDFLDLLATGQLPEHVSERVTSAAAGDSEVDHESDDPQGDTAAEQAEEERSGDSGAVNLPETPVVHDTDPDAEQLRKVVDLAERLGLAQPNLDAEITGADGEVLAYADAVWPEGLQSGRGDRVALLLEGDAEMERRLNQLGYRYFVGASDLRAHLIEEYGDGTLSATPAGPATGESADGPADSPTASIGTSGAMNGDAHLAAEHFHREMLASAEVLKRQIAYNPTRFLQMVAEHGGVGAAKRLLSGPDTSDGFTTLWEYGRLDLSLEAFAILPWYSELFSRSELKTARRRLELHEFDVDGFLAERSGNPPDWVG